jgi:conjugative transfer signal peptidase TraF
LRCVLAITALVVGAAMLVATDHVRLNLSDSMPLGFWWITAGQEPGRGDVVTVCLPGDAGTIARQHGYIGAGECAGDHEALLKPIVAMAGDVVTVTTEGLVVNGEFLPNSALLESDRAGRGMDIMALGTHIVAPHTFWIIATRDPRSFDSRYFGPLHVSTVQGTATPLLTW